MPLPPRNHGQESFFPERPTQQPESQMQPPQPPSPNHDQEIALSSPSSSVGDNFSLPPPPPPPPMIPFVDLPPWIKFVPNDEELILCYLKPFLRDKKVSSPHVPIHRVNIYESNPEQLTKEYEKGNDKEWFFMTERTKVSVGGKNIKRGDNNGGYWCRKGTPTKITGGEGVVGYKAALTYFIGKPPKRVKTDWLMQEYWIKSCVHRDDNNKVDFSLCKMYLSPSKRKAEEEDRKRSRLFGNN